ncbi:twin-arginine translocase TatA/TatE family subunit [Methanolobus profundi]|uniref:Sec-independent protein translocase protein TatA n=1 Tax=Methanolobus profundi TaxID=487685 RepID=A0A1I4QLF8_9EURY|nr:twin-arginine translocase TatA/TatE family subunit [Methanolobus profundi]SFM40596.1 Sec-independent protein translocase TatA [Methanolobus profundi]
MIGGLGPSELLIIFAVLLLLFGASKLPELARSMGSSMGEFKKAKKESELSVRDFENSIKDADSESEKTSIIEQTALNLGIDTKGKNEDELLAEINEMLKK